MKHNKRVVVVMPFLNFSRTWRFKFTMLFYCLILPMLLKLGPPLIRRGPEYLLEMLALKLFWLNLFNFVSKSSIFYEEIELKIWGLNRVIEPPGCTPCLSGSVGILSAQKVQESPPILSLKLITVLGTWIRGRVQSWKYRRVGKRFLCSYIFERQA